MSATTKSCPMCGTDAPADAERCQCGYRFASAKDASDAVERAPADATPTVHGDGWTMVGWCLFACGAIALIFAVMMGTSVETYTPSTPYSIGGPSEVVNLDLQFQKGLAIAGSLFAIGAGIFCLGVAAVVKAIDRKA